MSASGRAKTRRRGHEVSHLTHACRELAGRRPITWSQWSIASRRGARWALVIGSRAVVISTSGRLAPSRPHLRARLMSRAYGTTRHSTGRPRARTRSIKGATTARAASGAESVSWMTRIPALESGSRWKCRSKGSWLASLVVIPTPGAIGWTESIKRTGACWQASDPLRRDRHPRAALRPAPAVPSRWAESRAR